MSSSPESGSTPTNDGGRITHNHSTTSVTSTLSDGGLGGQDSPPHNTAHSLSPPAVVSHRVPTSSPNSPLMPSRGSTGKLQRGVKKLLRIPQTPNTVHHPPTLHEDPLGPGMPSKEALLARMFRGSRKIRSFRRTKRRGIDKQYHSDDGYTSDPGLLREEDEDETDDADTVVETRRQQQMRNLERKIEKLRQSLPEDDEVHGSEQDLDMLSMDDKPHNRLSLRLPRPSLRVKSQRKKLENWEAQLRLLQEGALPESRYTALRGKIGGGLRGMSLGLRGRLTFKRPKRFSGSSADEVIDDDEDDEALDEISQTEGVIHVETEEFGNETELLPMLKLKEDMEVVRQTSEDTLHDNQQLRKEFDLHKEQVEERIEAIYIKLEQEKERSERLEGQVNDITELHQHEVGELRAQIGQMESMNMSKNQDLEDAMEACQSRLERQEVFVHRLIDSGDKPISNMRKPAASIISFLLMVVTLAIKLFSFARTKVGLTVTLVIVLIAVLVYFVLYR